MPRVIGMTNAYALAIARKASSTRLRAGRTTAGWRPPAADRGGGSPGVLRRRRRIAQNATNATSGQPMPIRSRFEPVMLAAANCVYVGSPPAVYEK